MPSRALMNTLFDLRRSATMRRHAVTVAGRPHGTLAIIVTAINKNNVRKSYAFCTHDDIRERIYLLDHP